MKIHKLSHVAIAVSDLEAQLRVFRDLLGLEVVSREIVEDQGVRVAMLAVGETMIELLEPLGPDTPVGRHIDKRGPGIHHLAFEVDGLSDALAELSERGVRLIDEQPRAGAHGAQIAFIHPKATGGVLTELCQHGDDEGS